MATLPTNRTTSDSSATHVADHNELHGGHNLNETHRGRTDNPHATTAAQVGATTTADVYDLMEPLLAPKPLALRQLAGATMVTTLQSGHGWDATASTAGFTADLNHTADYVMGSQSTSITSGSGGTVRLSRTGMTAYDSTARQFALVLKVNDTALLAAAGLQFFAGSGGFASHYRWDAWTTGNETQAFALNDEWVMFIFNFQDANVVGTPARNNITDMRVAMTAAAGQVLTMKVNAVALIADPAPFPKGVISFAFDDGYLSQFTEVRRILDKYGYPATAYVVAEGIGVDPGLMTLAQMQQLQNANGWEVAGHAQTWAAHNATGGLRAMSADALDLELRAHKRWLLDNGFRGADHFAYPQGRYNATVLNGVRRYFSSARGTFLRIKETWPPADPYRLRTRMLGTGITLATVTGEVDKAYTNASWYIISGHKLAATAADGLTWAIADFQSLVDHIAGKGDMPVRTMGEVLARQRT